MMSDDWQDNHMDEVDALIARLSQPTEEELKAEAEERRELEERERFNRIFGTPQAKRVFEQIDEFINGKEGIQGGFYTGGTSRPHKEYAELSYNWFIRGIRSNWERVFSFCIDPDDGSYTYWVFVPTEKPYGDFRFEEFTDLGQALAVLEDRVEKARWDYDVWAARRKYGDLGLFPKKYGHRKAKRDRRLRKKKR
jgi:hypothetical protein